MANKTKMTRIEIYGDSDWCVMVDFQKGIYFDDYPFSGNVNKAVEFTDPEEFINHIKSVEDEYNDFYSVEDEE